MADLSLAGVDLAFILSDLCGKYSIFYSRASYAAPWSRLHRDCYVQGSMGGYGRYEGPCA